MGNFAIKIPWPFTNRSVYIAVSAMPVEGESAIIITMRSIKRDTWIKGLNVEKDNKNVEVDVDLCSVYIEMLEENK